MMSLSVHSLQNLPKPQFLSSNFHLVLQILNFLLSLKEQNNNKQQPKPKFNGFVIPTMSFALEPPLPLFKVPPDWPGPCSILNVARVHSMGQKFHRPRWKTALRKKVKPPH